MHLLHPRRASPRLAVLALVICASTAALAGPADKVYLPLVEKGETEFELRGGYRDFNAGSDEYAYIFDIGYGVTDRWKTELAVEYEGETGFGARIAAVEWENIIVLTEQGKHWADVGLFIEYEHTFADGPDEFKIGPMFMKEVGPAVVNLNFIFERQVGSNAGAGTELDYAWQVKWRGDEALEWGMQGFGALGTVDALGDDQKHSLGPALFGTRRLAGGNKLGYDAALLAGLNDAAPDLTFRFELEYEMY